MEGDEAEGEGREGLLRRSTRPSHSVCWESLCELPNLKLSGRRMQWSSTPVGVVTFWRCCSLVASSLLGELLMCTELLQNRLLILLSSISFSQTQPCHFYHHSLFGGTRAEI